MTIVDHTIAGYPDFELGLSPQRTVPYRIYQPERGSNGLVVYLPGFGADLGGYTQAFCEKVAGRHGCAALSVEYFCMRSRPQAGAKITFEPEDRRQLEAHLPLKIARYGTDERVLKAVCALKSDVPLTLTASLTPPDGSYQNFGIMAALDIVAAINDVLTRYPINRDNIILVGASYGGYLAQLVNKLRPGLVRALFDNSSWAEPNLTYVFGREIGACEYSSRANERVTLAMCVNSPWRKTAGHPHYFGPSEFLIRGFSRSQLEQMVSQGANQTFCLMVHSAEDRSIAPLAAKVEMAQTMLELGWPVEMLIYDASDIDGSYIKNTDHGMGLSMFTFFERGCEMLRTMARPFKYAAAEHVIYHAGKYRYEFDYRHGDIRARRCLLD